MFYLFVASSFPGGIISIQYVGLGEPLLDLAVGGHGALARSFLTLSFCPLTLGLKRTAAWQFRLLLIVQVAKSRVKLRDLFVVTCDSRGRDGWPK